ncbi:MAG TPA: Fe-S cluster assembly protein SufD [Ktedonobacterales bacterium]|nr:Fe-S cluster assembly protein SufD [Ktedonobacterales bacterium]
MTQVLTQGFSRAGVEALSQLKGEPAWMLEKRLAAWDIYEQTPAPLGRRGDLGVMTRVARYKYDALVPYVANGAHANGHQPLPNWEAGLLVQRNSTVAARELDPALAAQGVILTDMDTAVREHADLVQRYFMTGVTPHDNKYAALHFAFWSGGLFLYVPKGVIIDRPVLARYLLDQAGGTNFAHTLIIAETGSQVVYIEETASSLPEGTTALFNGVAEIFAKDNAHVQFNSVQDFGPGIWNLTTKHGVPEKDGYIHWIVADLGADTTLANLGTTMAGSGSNGDIVGVLFATGHQFVQINTLSNHAALSTSAETYFKGVLDDQARVDFEGLIKVAHGAQQTNSYLSDHTLLLSDEARAEAIPSLEIAANDVRASHGATTGQIDAEQLFYLMCRGIPEDQARRLIVQGFFEPVLDKIPSGELRARLRSSIVRKMTKGQQVMDESDWHDVTDQWDIEGAGAEAVAIYGGDE